MERTGATHLGIESNAIARRSALLGLLLGPLTIGWPAFAQEPPDLNKAFGLHRRRGSKDPGLQNVKDAIAIANAFLNTNPSRELQIYALTLLGASHSFLGLVSTEGRETIFKQGADAAEKLVRLHDIRWDAANEAQRLKGEHSAAELDSMALAVMLWATNLAGFGQASGTVQALGLWPKIRTLCELSLALDTNERLLYTHLALMGAFYYKIPSLLGGDMARATQYLKKAAAKTKLPDVDCSANGFVNLYYAQILDENGDTAQAKSLAKNFIDADPKLFPAEIRPENEAYRRETIDFLKGL